MADVDLNFLAAQQAKILDELASSRKDHVDLVRVLASFSDRLQSFNHRFDEIQRRITEGQDDLSGEIKMEAIGRDANLLDRLTQAIDSRYDLIVAMITRLERESELSP